MFLIVHFFLNLIKIHFNVNLIFPFTKKKQNFENSSTAHITKKQQQKKKHVKNNSPKKENKVKLPKGNTKKKMEFKSTKTN